jgi:glutaredoxin
MNNKIELYLLDGCDKCSRIKYALLADEIKYEEDFVDSDPDAEEDES